MTATPSPPTLWHATTPESGAYPALDAEASADVAIIGGGITGVATARELARSGADTVLLEARRIGWGASGRNAGFVVPNFAGADPAAVVGKLGAARGRRLLDLVGRGADRVFAIARERGLATEAEQTGWLQPAHSAEAAETLRRRVADWQALGRPVNWLDAAETAERTGTDIYHGALHDASGGVINPLAYLRAVACDAAEAGARIFEHAPLTSTAAESDGWRLGTESGGSVRAGRVLICTNADSTGVAAQLAKAVVPLRVYQIATAPIPGSEVARIAPRREPVSDTRENLFTYRLDGENRLISGGMAMIPGTAEKWMGRRIAARLAHELNLADTPPVEHVWSGTAAVTADFLPHVYELGPGFLGAIGCNGRGVAMTTMMGEALAPALLGTCGVDELAVPVAPPRAMPFRPLGRIAPSAFLARGMWRDRAALRKTKARKAHPPQPTEESLR